jgi:hypothetical protein
MEPPSYIRSVVDRNVVMRRMTVIAAMNLCMASMVILLTYDHNITVRYMCTLHKLEMK